MDVGGRKGWISLEREKDVPIVPVFSLGGQETALCITRGERLAKLLHLDRMFRLKVLPLSLSLPCLITIGPMAGPLPLPAKIRVRALDPVNIRGEFGPD